MKNLKRTKNGLVKATHLAEYLGVHRQTIASYIDAGILPEPLFLNGRVQGWRVDDIQKFLEERERYEKNRVKKRHDY